MRFIIDPRSDRKKKHDYVEILTCVVIGYLVGRTSLRRSIVWCERHLEWLRKYMKLENGIASVSTISRLLSNIDEIDFVDCFIEWMTAVLNTKGLKIAIDGKALRGGTERIKDGKTPYILNAIDTVTELVIAQLPIKDKECEKTAILKLLEYLNIKDSIITIDAIGTTEPIISKIVEEGGHYLLTVKKGNPLTYEELHELFPNLKKELRKKEANPLYRSPYEQYLDSYDKYETSEKNRSRMEYRTMEICRNISTLTYKTKVPSIKTIGWLQQVRIPIEKDNEGKDITPDKKTFLAEGTPRHPKVNIGDGITDEVHQVGIISDIELQAQECLEIKRNHWKIENSLHHCLDDTLREDRSTAKKSKNNLAVIRKIVYNILKIACIHDNTGKGLQAMSDEFADDLELVAKNVFYGIKGFR